MQKLTILILITLILSPLLYAVDETIILDKDILYWKPAGPDLTIPDFYFSAEIFKYPEGSFKSSLFFPLNKNRKVYAQEKEEEELSEQLLLINWTPPTLFTVKEEIRKNTITAYSSYPYGSGVKLYGGDSIFQYDLGANYAHGEDHPHWLAAALELNSTHNILDTRFAWRSKEDNSFLSLLDWDIKSSSSEKLDIFAGVGFQSLYTSQHQWKAQALLGAEFKMNIFNIEASLTGEYRDPVSESYWRISPELFLNRKYKGRAGDWSIKAGILTDLYTGEKNLQYFPQLQIEYIKYGKWSVFLLSESDELDNTQIHSFLTEEFYNSPELDFYRYHKLGTGFYITENHFQLRMEGGYISGIFPEIDKTALISKSMSLYFIDSSLSWNYNTGKVTELNCYADYQDKGSLRFSIENRWLWKKTEEESSFGFLLRAGNRELLRGYRYFFDESSDLMTGVGVEIDWLKPLQTAVYMDYLPLNKSIEGRIELSWAY